MRLLCFVRTCWLTFSLLLASGSTALAQNKTATLKEYYETLLAWEGNSPSAMIETWPRPLVSEIEIAVTQSVEAGSVIGYRCPILPESTNQSIGNQVEQLVLPRIADKLAGFKMEKCSGAGYPDWLVVRLESGLRMPLEIKATSAWNASDSNRRVLTSSSTKLRRQFIPPIHHLLLTVLYQVEVAPALATETADGTPAQPLTSGTTAVVKGIRLDFLEPDTQVSIRLEASVNHRVLSAGTHEKLILPSK